MYVEFRDLGKSIVTDASKTHSVQLTDKNNMTVVMADGEALVLKYENEETAYNDYRRFRTKLRKAYAPWCNKEDGENGDEPAEKPAKIEKPVPQKVTKPVKK